MHAKEASLTGRLRTAAGKGQAATRPPPSRRGHCRKPQRLFRDTYESPMPLSPSATAAPARGQRQWHAQANTLLVLLIGIRTRPMIPRNTNNHTPGLYFDNTTRTAQNRRSAGIYSSSRSRLTLRDKSERPVNDQVNDHSRYTYTDIDIPLLP